MGVTFRGRRGDDLDTTGSGGAEAPLLTVVEAQLNMKVLTRGATLAISGLKELAAANSQAFRDQVRGALTEEQRDIEIDLSETMFVDSCGLGALISLHKAVGPRNGQVRLLHPTPPVRQILELTRMHRIFEIVNHS